MMDGAGFAGLGDQPDPHPPPGPDQRVVHGRDGQQHRDGGVAGIDAPVADNQDARTRCQATCCLSQRIHRTAHP